MVEPFEILLQVFLGFGVGVIGALLGIGGGFIVVPFLLLYHGFSPGWAAGTSLLVVLINALSGFIAFFRQKRVDIKMATAFTIGSVPGSIIGSVSTAFLSSAIFRILFAGALGAAAAYLISRPEVGVGGEGVVKGGRPRKLVDSAGREYSYVLNLPLVSLFAVLSGFIAGFFGVGGGIVNVPVMVIFLGVPAHIATATSHLVLVVTSATGIATHASLGHVELLTGMLIGAGALFGAQAGAKISQKLRGRTIEILLALFLIVIALSLIIQSLTS
ncbi:MAG: sulfite exporter TauE/SafE family protein [Nitrososphaerota archaeon]